MASQVTATTREPASPVTGGFNWTKLFTYVVLIVGAAIAIIPFLATVSISLMNLTEATSQTFIPSTPQWGNYIEAWQEADFSEFFFNSLIIALITVAGEVVFGVLDAYAFARMEFPGKNLLFGLSCSFLVRQGNPFPMDRQLAGINRALHGQRLWYLFAAPIFPTNS